MIIEALKAFLIGIVEGITEWLPISSTGHMILVDEFVKLNVSAEFLELFLVVIQLGAIMAVLILYFHKLNPFSPKKDAVEKKSTWRLWGMVAIGCIPAAVIGLLFDDLVNEYFYNKVTVAAMLILLALGASDETICQDFVRTNVCRRPELEKIWAAHAEEIEAHPEQKQFYQGIAGVHPESAPFVLDTIRKEYGTTDAYLEAEYGLTPARLMRLRRMYLE